MITQDVVIRPLNWLYVVSGIWFGVWGVAAAWAGTTLSRMLAFGFGVSAVLSVSTILAALIPAWAFRHFKADPRIKTSRDGALFMFLGVLLSSFALALAEPLIFYVHGWIPNIQTVIGVSFPSLVFPNLVFTPIFGFTVLLLFSNDIINARAYCRGWFS